MSREWTTYQLTCKGCGAVGSIRMWSDDWNRWGADWGGFRGKVYVTGPKPDLIVCETCEQPNPTIVQL